MCLLNVLIVTAAQEEMQSIQFRGEVDPISVRVAACNYFVSLRDLFNNLGADILFAGNQDSMRVPCSRADFEGLVYLSLLQGQANREAFLQTLGVEDLISFIRVASDLDLSNETDAYTDLIEYGLRRLTVEQLRSLLFIAGVDANGIEVLNALDDGFLDPLVMERALKRMQFDAILNANREMHDLAHPGNLGAGKVALLKEVGLWNFTISIQNLYDNLATRHLVTIENVRGLRTLDLSDLQLASLQGIRNIPGIDTVQEISLYNNQLTTVVVGELSNLPDLQSLTLGKNKLVVLGQDVFSDLPALREIYVFENRLATIVPGIFRNVPNLRRINFSNNPLLTREAFHAVLTNVSLLCAITM